VNQEKFETFLGKMVGEMGASLNASLVVIGDKLGLYKALADGKPVTSAELASKTNCTERYVREWLNAQAASGYLEYDAASQRYTLPEEHAMALANEDSPAFVAGAFYSVIAIAKAVEKMADRFKSGQGLGWHEHDPWLFCGTERLFRPGYRSHLINNWIPALDGVEAKLQKGARVADVGCGHGASTVAMAEKYPQSEFTGFDFHPASVETARQRASEKGLKNTKFEQAAAKEFPGPEYDLICMFDCLHDMGDPAGASKHVHARLKPDGTFLLVEPFAQDKTEDNHNPIGRVFYAASTMVCTPCSLSQEVGTALGAQAGEARLREVVTSGGFRQFRRAAETPFNMVFEARP
jgi:SAM-dependent methyltransferase